MDTAPRGGMAAPSAVDAHLVGRTVLGCRCRFSQLLLDVTTLQGIVPAPEPTHALAEAIREALRCK